MSLYVDKDQFEKDIFISYSRVDSDKVLDFVSSLQDSGIDYWLDQINIGWGENLIDRVFSGIEKSRYVIVFISENSLKSQWVSQEIRTAFHKELEYGLVVLLPVISCSEELVYQKFPFLRGKKFIKFENNDYILENLIRLLRGDPHTIFTFNHPRHYYGPVWIRLIAMAENSEASHQIVIRWGVWYREVNLELNDREPVFLTHSKGNDGQSIPIIVHLDKPAYVSIGQGRPNYRRQIDINPFWVDAKSRLKILIAKFFLWPRSSS